METKRIIITLTDVETGEILGSNIQRNYNNKTMLPIDVIKKKSADWFNSFIRGLDSGRNLNLSITVRPCPSAEGALPFDKYIEHLRDKSIPEYPKDI